MPSDSRNWPIGQANVHVFAAAAYVAPARQLVQLVDVPEVHVAQVASQSWQILLASAYLPPGQAETHAPSS